MARLAVRDTELCGVPLPKGTQALASQWVLHRDARFFPSPERFRPERWLSGETSALPRFAYFPFGGGPRVCIGQHFSLLELTLILARFAQSVRFERERKAKLELAPVVTLRPKGPVRFLIRRREPGGRRRTQPNDERAARALCGAGGELTEHVVQDAAVPVVVELDRGIDARERLELLARAARLVAVTRRRLRGASLSAMPSMENVSSPVSPRLSRFSPAKNSSGMTPMPMRFERWMRSYDSTSTARTPSITVPLAAQSRDEPEPYSLPRDDDERDAGRLVLHRSLEDAHLLAGREVARDAAFDAGNEQVLQAHVRERAAHHHFVIAAARAVLVEVARGDAVLLEVLRGRGALGDVAGRRDVVGRHRIAEQREHARAARCPRAARASCSCRRRRSGGARRCSPRPKRTGRLRGRARRASASSPVNTSAYSLT